MLRTILSTTTMLLIIGTASPAAAQSRQGTTTNAKADLKFLDDISIGVSPAAVSTSNVTTTSASSVRPAVASAASREPGTPALDIEAADKLQFKYAILLNTEVEQVLNLNLFRAIDEWLGAAYRLGGTTKAGVDCSALMQALFAAVYNITLPRTSREQFTGCLSIDRTELREGDLVFFNTSGKISHVGLYLQNDKFVHASSSGVMISDLNEEYWVKRFVGAGRIEAPATASTLHSKP